MVSGLPNERTHLMERPEAPLSAEMFAELPDEFYEQLRAHALQVVKAERKERQRSRRKRPSGRYWTTRVTLGVIAIALFITTGIIGLALFNVYIAGIGALGGWALVIWLFATETDQR